MLDAAFGGAAFGTGAGCLAATSARAFSIRGCKIVCELGYQIIIIKIKINF